MTGPDPARERQRQAADPALSTWLSANAGSGKTAVLIDRVARLLLLGARPERILCLTYTKAAASEMQNRLFQRLGDWAMMDDDALRVKLSDLGPEAARADLRRARRLFAEAIETPGGLKIQTIHAFCAGLLRRFPAEAGVSPGFTELDDVAARQLRLSVVEAMAADGDSSLSGLAPLLSDEDLPALLSSIAREGAGPAPPDRRGLWRTFGLPEGLTEADLVRDAVGPDGTALLVALVPHLANGTKTVVDKGKALAKIDASALGIDDLSRLESLFLWQSGENEGQPRIPFPTKPVWEAIPLAERGAIEAFMHRVATVRSRRIALAAARASFALRAFAAAFCPRYAKAKEQHGALDFDDLVGRTGTLLSDSSVAAWVLWKLDGGIDHILVDEAQDTSPAQWKLVEKLTEEFTTGEGARDLVRTLFVVGDRKQSIYSFQGADLARFDEAESAFRKRFADAGSEMSRLELEHSFRSAPAVLRVVDLTFDRGRHAGLGSAPSHLAFHANRPGRVDLWAPIEEPEKQEPDDWIGEGAHLHVPGARQELARAVAEFVRRTIDAGTQIVTRAGETRRVHEGDFLVLVQTRKQPFDDIIRACKAARLAVAGADRLRLGAEVAVRDLIALLSFMALPEDDLSLATVLRSPLFGWSERDLYALAQPRPAGGYLWAALRGAGERYAGTVAILDDLRTQADFLRPYELLERALTRHDLRRKLVARLGREAEEGIDVLLAQAIAYEAAEVPSVTGFLARIRSDDIEVKRRVESGSRAVRIMTVHGAKGLEAPIVILADCAIQKDRERDRILRDAQGTPFWRMNAKELPSALQDAIMAERARSREESMRLLYVAMTRAESWLVVAAAGKTGSGEESWHAMVADAMESAGSDTVPSPVPQVSGMLRHASGEWPPDSLARPAEAAPAESLPPAWLLSPLPPAGAAPRSVSPSDLGGAKALPGEGGRDEALAMARGTLVHALLQFLPGVPPEDRAALVMRLADPGMPSHEVADALAEAARVLDDPVFAWLFAPGTLAEVEISAALPLGPGLRALGAIDRLVVARDRVVAVDFKTNAVVPERPEDVPEGILRQLGAYEAMLREVYPGRTIETAVLWTRRATLMTLPPEIVRYALGATPIP